jgi:aminoglycoside phosphotransferase (APT) family kinase protein
MDSLIGTRLGPYEIVAAIGAGGMGEVYRAHDTRLGREVAIKVLPGALAADPDALARFEREARAVAAINHPNILALHDIGTHNGIAHAVMELLEGETLRARLGSGPPPPRKALEWAVQIANGLAAAHDRGIVHRDLKPENVFLTRDGRVKILDFGIARRDRPDAEIGSNVTTLSERGLFVGTPAYASPEQVVGEPATPRSDLFSFGVLLYELLTGVNPFLRETVADTMTAVLRVDPPSLSAAVPGVPPAALRIVERCLEKQPSERPSSAHDLALFLDASSGTTHEPALAVPPDEARAAARRLQLKVLIASGGLLLAVVATTWAYVAIGAGRAVDAALGRQLERDQRLVVRVHSARLDRLQFTARLVASFPALKSLFDTQDPATVRDFLLSYRQQNPGTPLLVAIEPSGVVLGSTETPESGGAAAAGGWRDAAFAGKGQPRVVAIGGRPHHTASAAAAAGGNVFGYVVAAEPVDGEFARTIAESTGDEAVVLSRSAVLGSTLTGGATPWKSIEDWRQRGGSSDSTAMIVIGATRFAAREVPLTPDPAVSVVLARSRDEALEPYRQIQAGLVLIGLAGVVAALLSSVWLYRVSRVSVPAR